MSRPAATLRELRELAADDAPTVVSVPRAGRLLGMERWAAYDAVRRGAFPVPVIKTSGRRFVVPTAALLRVLGFDGHDPPNDESGPDP
jgi:hypothetical protein